jgi:hypothetical protein
MCLSEEINSSAIPRHAVLLIGSQAFSAICIGSKCGFSMTGTNLDVVMQKVRFIRNQQRKHSDRAAAGPSEPDVSEAASR